MPTPVGHAIGGLAAAWLVQSVQRQRRFLDASGSEAQLAFLCAAVAVLPDFDLLLGTHRGYTHSLGAVAAVGVISWLLLQRHTSSASTAVITAAYGSHLLLDWLGKDSADPAGLMLLWPLSSRFYISGFDAFSEVSRRYWNVDEFIVGNFRAVGWELLILTPVAIAAWLVRKRFSTRHCRGGR
jgi:membrane-bound metal-dependent hydrolase YbcI (DUF457 family)